jgi:outer membrane protein, adhesin transport system
MTALRPIDASLPTRPGDSGARASGLRPCRCLGAGATAWITAVVVAWLGLASLTVAQPAAPAAGEADAPVAATSSASGPAAAPAGPGATAVRPSRARPAAAVTSPVGAGSAAAQAISASPSGGRCADDEPVEAAGHGAKGPSRPVDASAPRTDLKSLVRLALERSHSIGAARLLADAAALDVDEARAGAKPTASMSANLGGVLTQQDGLPNAQGGQARASVILSAPLFDSGRVAETTGWRQHLAEAARQGQIGAEEQVALQTVSLALERNRFRLQSQIYRQYSRKMSCLVEALEIIVSRDRGRQSELVQAQKTQAQAELARVQAVAQMRQAEIRLRRFVGDGLPPSEGLSSLWLTVPELPDLLTAAENAPEIAQLRAQADAGDSFTRIIATQGRPQVSWVLSGSAAAGAGNPRNVAAGINVTVPLLTPSLEPASNAARKRAEAARLQVAEAVLERRTRVTDVHDQASTAFDRARRISDVLRDTDRVRISTLQQWQQLGRRSLFDVMGAEAEHYNQRVAYVNALTDGQQSSAILASLAGGVREKLD